MKRYVPYEKLSKKARRELDSKSRSLWNVSPVTKIVKNKKKYDRKSIRRRRNVSDFDFFSSRFLFLTGSYRYDKNKAAAVEPKADPPLRVFP